VALAQARGHGEEGIGQRAPHITTRGALDMPKLAELFDSRFDLEEGEDGVSLICNECGTTIKIPSPIEALTSDDPDMDHDPEMDHANQILKFVEQIFEHLDECKPTDG
jgi:hypothetical protein